MALPAFVAVARSPQRRAAPWRHVRPRVRPACRRPGIAVRSGSSRVKRPT